MADDETSSDSDPPETVSARGARVTGLLVEAAGRDEFADLGVVLAVDNRLWPTADPGADRNEAMWRLCDLHSHTAPNEQCDDEWQSDAFIESCIRADLDVVAVTDHDHCDHVAEVVTAAEGTRLTVIPGVEISTDRGHILALAPGEDGLEVIRDFMTRVGASPGQQVALEEVLSAARAGTRPGGARYSQRLVLVGAHVDAAGSLLGTPNQLGLEGQLELARKLHALEVSRDEVMEEWAKNGVKQGPHLPLLRGSDTHDPSARLPRATWLYLPDVTAPAFRHAFAVPEASIRYESPPAPPARMIESISFTGGGHHDGLTFDLCERTNALIGPPNSGKSLIVDALKFVFGLSSDLDEVENISKSRMAKCLPAGCTVEVRVRTPDGPAVLRRTVGGAQPPSPPFRPIVFSQTELTRRSIAPAPAIALLDLHCPNAASLKASIAGGAAEVEQYFLELLATARDARELRRIVSNPEDGLAATKAELERIAGTEEVAKLASSATQVDSWRSRAREVIEEWRDEEFLSSPTFPLEPSPISADLQQFVPEAELEAIGERLRAEVAERRNAAAAEMLKVLDADETGVKQLNDEVLAQLKAAGFDEGSEVAARLGELRSRATDLEAKQRELGDLEAQIDTGLVRLRELHDAVVAAQRALTQARKDTCSRVSESMRTFFARIYDDGVTERLDGLIETLKTGTWMREQTLQRARDELERFKLLEVAVRREQGRVVDDEEASDQDRLVGVALERGHGASIAQLACLWPGNALELSQRTSPPTPFDDLTEGLRALAIKEISFAVSDLPVITDQPEDAVPTRSVFESLVPTLREQRADRQFLVVSHDANIVVASDVDRIWALQANEDLSPHVGSLFDPRVRRAAMEHLEGGESAFEQRAQRYAEFAS